VFNARLKVLTSSHPDDMHLLGDQITKKHHPVIQIEKDLNVSFVRASLAVGAPHGQIRR
jgi:desulfoferrodoxin (superoxide reductase-like protein)